MFEPGLILICPTRITFHLYFNHLIDKIIHVKKMGLENRVKGKIKEPPTLYSRKKDENNELISA